MTDEKKEKPQAFVAKYDLSMVTIPRNVTYSSRTSYWIEVPIPDEKFPHQKKVFVAEETVDYFREYGLVIKSKTEEEKDSSISETFANDAKRICSGINKKGPGHNGFYSYGCITVTTEARLGPQMHKENRLLVERFLKERRIDFTLDCQMVFSSNVCQPLIDENSIDSLSELFP